MIVKQEVRKKKIFGFDFRQRQARVSQDEDLRRRSVCRRRIRLHLDKQLFPANVQQQQWEQQIRNQVFYQNYNLCLTAKSLMHIEIFVVNNAYELENQNLLLFQTLCSGRSFESKSSGLEVTKNGPTHK